MHVEAIITAILGSGVLSTLIAQVFAWAARREERRSGTAEGMRLVLKDRLRCLCLHYIDQGWIYEDELEDLMAMHRCYHEKLHGNGYLNELMRRVKQLAIRGVR